MSMPEIEWTLDPPSESGGRMLTGKITLPGGRALVRQTRPRLHAGATLRSIEIAKRALRAQLEEAWQNIVDHTRVAS